MFALISAFAVAGCEGALGDSPPHAAPANPTAEGAESRIELRWSAVAEADKYTILWRDETMPAGEFTNKITDIEDTSYSHTGLVNLRLYEYRIAAETSGGRGPESITVRAEPGPLPGAVEWAVVTSEAPGHTIHFAAAEQTTSYRIYFAGNELALIGQRPNAQFEVATGSPHFRPSIGVLATVFYRVVAMNDDRVGPGSPVVISPTHTLNEFSLVKAGAAFGDPNHDQCLDLATGAGALTGGFCQGTFNPRVLADAGLADLVAAGRTTGDSRYADFTGDKRDDLFSNTLSAADVATSFALLHANTGTGSFQTSAGVSALGIGGFGGTVLAADFDNDGDVDVFAPNDHTRGDGARNWLLINNGGGVFTDTAVAAGVAANPAGAAYVPRGGQAVDFNEDGFIDLLVGSRLLINNGNGTFTDGSAAAGIPVLADQGLKLFDVDLDGDFDLLHHDGAVTRLYRNQAGVFGAGTVVLEFSAPTFGFGLNACDVNSDGWEDVLVSNNLTSTGIGAPKLLINVAGTLTDSAVQQESTPNTNNLHAHNDLIACGDVDGNRVIDVVSRWGTGYRLLRAASTLTRPIRIRVLGAGGERNQQGRVVRIAPVSAPSRIMTRVVESGSGLHSQNQYDLLVGAPWVGEYAISVRFAAGVVNTTAVAGDDLTIFSDGRVVENLQP